MSTLFPPRRPTTARWVWGPHDPQPQNLMRRFRCRVLVADPQGCRLHLAADTRYRLWVNGVWIGRGAPQSMPWLTYEATHDLSAVLRRGANELAIAVYHLGTVAGARPGLRAELVAGDGAVLTATGDAAWRTRPDPTWTANAQEFPMNARGRFQEVVDLRGETGDWITAESGDGWLPAEPVSGRGPWTLVVPSHIPAPAETPLPPPVVAAIEECQGLNRLRSDLSIDLSQAGRPLRRALADLQADGTGRLACAHPADRDDTAGVHDPCVLYDAGRVVTAIVELDVEAPAGAEVQLGFAERLVDGHFTNALECWFAARFTCRAGRQVLRLADWRAFRWLRLRLRRCPTPLTIHAVRLVEVAYPLGEPAPFTCGDAQLERIRAISLASLRLCCVDGIYDTPHREGAQWLGDVALVSVPMLQDVFAAAPLVGKWLRQSHAGRTPSGFLSNLSNTVAHDPGAVHQIPDYSLWWAWAAHRHWRWTGDQRWIDLIWPGVLGLLAAHRNLLGEDGLVQDVPGWVFIDWAPVGRERRCAAYNALLAIACDAIADMAAVRGDAVAAAEARDLRAGIARAFAATFWDDAAGCVRDGDAAGTVSEHANAAAILAGLLTPTQVQRAVATVFAQPRAGVVEAEPFFMAVVLPALRRAGHVDLALDLVRHRYGRMLAQGATSVFEEWGENGSWRTGRFEGFQRTHSHAWSGCPATFLIEAFAGIEILAPGGSRVRVHPHRTPFPWRVGCHVGAGLVTVAWDGNRVSVAAAPGIVVEGA